MVSQTIDDARLNDGIAIAQIDFQNLLHPRQDDHHAAADRQTAAGQARAGPARQEGDAVFVADLDDRGHVLRRGGKDDHVGAVLFDHEAVALVDDQFAMRGQEALVADDLRSRETNVAKAKVAKDMAAKDLVMPNPNRWSKPGRRRGTEAESPAGKTNHNPL